MDINRILKDLWNIAISTLTLASKAAFMMTNTPEGNACFRGLSDDRWLRWTADNWGLLLPVSCTSYSQANNRSPMQFLHRRQGEDMPRWKFSGIRAAQKMAILYFSVGFDLGNKIASDSFYEERLIKTYTLRSGIRRGGRAILYFSAGFDLGNSTQCERLTRGI